MEKGIYACCRRHMPVCEPSKIQPPHGHRNRHDYELIFTVCKGKGSRISSLPFFLSRPSRFAAWHPARPGRKCRRRCRRDQVILTSQGGWELGPVYLGGGWNVALQQRRHGYPDPSAFKADLRVLIPTVVVQAARFHATQYLCNLRPPPAREAETHRQKIWQPTVRFALLWHSPCTTNPGSLWTLKPTA